MFQSILMMGGLGVAIGTVLVIASKAFYVYEDPKVIAIDDVLPGANCGGCGYPGCNANAEAIVEGKQDVNSCVAAGDDVALAIAQIMGVSVSDKEPEFAGLGCFYGNDDADMEYKYLGITDCRAAVLLFGGMKVCRIGCLGLGTCVKACMFGALSIGSDGLPKVDQEKCTGCGACERVCPKNIIRLTSVTRRIMREYTQEECITPCQRACPTGIDIKEYIRLIKEGNFEGSVQVIKERNPFPTVISRICPAPCEFKCRRLLQDESVAINHLKRFVCDYEMNQDKRILPYKAPLTGKKVAVIGGGVEGLSTAFFTARLGHAPTVFEATDSLGGILRVAIARERLAMDVLDWDIEGVKEMGVDIQTNAKAGTDFTIDGLLKQGFQAVFTATGGWDSRLARGDIDQAQMVFPGAYLLIDLLRSKLDKSIRISSGENVVIVGGGIRVPDAVHILKENGSKKIIVISRKHPDESSFDPEAIDELSIDKLSGAGATIIYHTGVTKVIGEEGQLKAIEYIELDTGVKHVIDTDTLIIGSGRFPELVFIPVRNDEQDGEEDLIINNGPLVWEGVELQKKPDANKELGLLSNQDVISEYSSAVAAINGGRKAAAAIHNLMYGIEFQESFKFITEQTLLQDVSFLNDVDTSPQNIMELGKIKKSSKDKFSTGFSAEQARAEAGRCLRCGLICYEKSTAFR
ncbi:MAG: RnfABCDGE type electron transport complex subunit B [Desulfobacula sp.]|uniref:RnfABCDGE type electron transport complex subunit B n=1 Tax=Desulfobacula sp. TaxID=2593537 RepID=UPI0025BF8E35|nr:RnfABCDGE type electron transport complex subunit B [Desulfobacula sp.]MCD4718250.1 RnfABCDGE type electron transport complex subunit B [Desulfobacula sp.]